MTRSHLTRLVLALALAASFAVGLATGPAEAHGTPYACSIASPNLLPHYGCAKAWRTSNGTISGQFADRHTDGYVVSIWGTNTSGPGAGYWHLISTHGSTSAKSFASGWTGYVMLCRGTASSSSTCLVYTP